MSFRILHATAPQPGAIAILQIHGECRAALSALTGRSDWDVGSIRWTRFGDIDDGMAGLISARCAQLMPHGGPRVVQRLTARLIELGGELGGAADGAAIAATPPIDPCELYPEARDPVEALMLHALSRAASPLAIDLLLDQPRRWQQQRGALNDADLQRARHLNRLIEPPTVVLAGRPNVGKSTLSNALIGRAMSIALDMPGTTRDYVTGHIDLAGLVVNWHDTAGLRCGHDTIEQKAVDFTRQLIGGADLLIAMADPTPQGAWRDLPREPDLRVMSKSDTLIAEAQPPQRSGALQISALTGSGLPELVRAARDLLVPPGDLAHPGRWLFDARLQPRA